MSDCVRRRGALQACRGTGCDPGITVRARCCASCSHCLRMSGTAVISQNTLLVTRADGKQPIRFGPAAVAQRTALGQIQPETQRIRTTGPTAQQRLHQRIGDALIVRRGPGAVHTRAARSVAISTLPRGRNCDGHHAIGELIAADAPGMDANCPLARAASIRAATGAAMR